jgi:CRP/FNR family transcriptional regulator, cyclic AMP receptor protein
VAERSWERPTAKDWADVLARLPLFSRCRKRQLRKLAGLAKVKEYPPDSVVIQAGDPSRAFYLILSGQARVGKPRGGLLRTGDYFGEMGLIDGEPRAASIVAVDELQVMTLPRAPFLRLLEQEPGIAVAMLAELAQRVRSLEKSHSAL